MILEENTDIVLSSERSQINGEKIEILRLADGKAIALASNAIAVYKSTSAIHDALGQGLIDIAELPEDLAAKNETLSMTEHKAGFVGLTQGMVLLILPNAVNMYRSKEDALFNRSAIATLKLRDH